MDNRPTRVPAALLLALAVIPANATFHLVKIVELFPGTAAAPDAQYVVLQMYASGQNLVQGHALTFFNADGEVVGSASFAGNVANGSNQAKVLIATTEAATFFGVQPDLVMDPDLLAAGGKACFAGNVDCVAWGAYVGGDDGGGGYGGGGADTSVGTPFNATGGLESGRATLRRLNLAGGATTLDAGDDTNDSANDFVFGTPAPRNNAGQLGQVPGATCGNGSLEGLEQCDDGNLSNADTCSSTCLVQEAQAAPPASDFDADGASDVLWRHDRTGANTAWRSANLTTSLPVSDVSNLAWRVVGVGDFDADGHADVLWRNGNTGANTAWRSANAAAQIRVTTVTSQAWGVAGVGDFDGDGHDDLFWRNASTGANTIWRSANSGSRIAVASVAGASWKVAAIGDFDDDGSDDVFWRNASTGANRLWRSANSSTRIDVPDVTNTAWRVAGSGDFDADGHDDLFWRNATTGANTIWRSANAAAQIRVTTVASQSWQVRQVADFDGDGHDDLFWRNAGTGANTAWRSGNSATRISVATVASSAWKVVP
jgi:cysteine-rich repeat protein